MKKTKISLYSVIVFIILAVYTLSIIYLCFWTLLNSVKSRGDFLVNPLGIPKEFKFSNFETAYLNFKMEITQNGNKSYVYIEGMFLNSVLYAVGVSLVSTFVCCIMSYVVAKYNYKFSKVLYGIVIVTMILPIVGNLPSQIQMARSLGIFDTFLGMLIMSFTFLSSYFLVFFAIFKSLPWTYAEAAFIDGASHMKVFFLIMFPMVKTTFTTVFLLNFIANWNNYQTPMVFLPSMPTLSYGLYAYTRDHTNTINTVPMQLAGCILVFLPVLVVFLVFKKWLMGNLTMGGLKG